MLLMCSVHVSVCVCSYLWVFVSKFTDFDASRLHRLYKQALKKQEVTKRHAKRPPAAADVEVFVCYNNL